MGLKAFLEIIHYHWVLTEDVPQQIKLSSAKTLGQHKSLLRNKQRIPISRQEVKAAFGEIKGD